MTDGVGARRRTLRRTRRARRRGEALGKRIGTAGAAVALAAVLAFLVYASVTSAPWRFGGYTVQGTSYLTAPEVLRAAGFEEGDNLFWVDLEEARRNLCRHPRIRRAEVRRRLPAELVVTVEERSAAAALILNGALYKIAADGVVLEAMAAGYEDVPVLVGARYRVPEDIMGKRLNRGEVKEALATVEALRRVDGAWGAAVDYVDINDHLVVLAAGRYQVKYGAGFDERTARRIRRVYEATRPAGRGAVTFDARFGTDVIVTGGDDGADGEADGDAGGDAADDGAV